MLKIAITGGIACGKSTVSSMLQTRGYAVWSADEAVRLLCRPGAYGWQRLVEHFGDGILTTEGQIDREAFGARVFSDQALREDVNRILHPELRRRCREWVQGQRGVLCFAEIPLLYEAGWEQDWDCVLCVRAAQSLRQDRLLAQGLSLEQVQVRFHAQMALDLKVRLADFVVSNDGTKSVLEEQVEHVMKSLMEMVDE